MKCNKRKCKVLCLGRSNPRYHKRLRSWLAGKQLRREGPGQRGGQQTMNQHIFLPAPSPDVYMWILLTSLIRWILLRCFEKLSLSAIRFYVTKFSRVSHSYPLPYFVEVLSLYIIFSPDYRVQDSFFLSKELVMKDGEVWIFGFYAQQTCNSVTGSNNQLRKWLSF